MKIHASFTVGDYIKARYLDLRPRRALAIAGVFMLGLTVFVSLGALLGWLGDKPISPWIPLALLGGLLYLVIIYFVELPLQVRRIFKQQRTFHEPLELELMPTQMTATSSKGTVTVPWADFHRYKTSTNLILVYQSDVAFHLFPRRWFSEDEFALLQQWLKAAFDQRR